MSHQPRAGSKGQLTVLASVGLFARVYPLVGSKVPVAAETFPALPALVRLFPRVAPMVQDQALLVSKTFPALRAGKRPLVAVGHLMSRQI